MVPCSQQPAKMNSVNDTEHNILSYVSCRALQMKPTDSSLQITRPVGMTEYRPSKGHFQLYRLLLPFHLYWALENDCLWWSPCACGGVHI